MPELETYGDKFFRAYYGETAEQMQNLLHNIYPDMGVQSFPSLHDRLNNGVAGWFSNTIAYGSVYGHLDILDVLETSFVQIGTLIAIDTPRQIKWHLENARRGGASLEQVGGVTQIAVEVSESVGVKWRDGVPQVEG